MTPHEQIEWALSLVSTLARGGYYGSVTFQIQNGEITIGRLEQTVKPVVSTRKHWKSMTLQEYLQWRGEEHRG